MKIIKNYIHKQKNFAEVVEKLLLEIQEKFKKFRDKEFLDEIMKKGAKKAQDVANKTLKRVTNALGLN